MDRLGSGWLPLTMAVLVIVPEAVEATLTTTVIVDEAPSARLPTFSVTVWPAIVAGLSPLADMVGSAGRQRIDDRHARGVGRTVVRGLSV